MDDEGGYQQIDERFRNLPGIAIGEKTVYETEDLPEADRGHNVVGVLDDDDLKNDSIEFIRIDPADAFIKLQGRFLDPGFTTRQDIAEAAKGYSIFAREIHAYGEAPTVDDNINRRFRAIKDQIEQLQYDIQVVQQFRTANLGDEELEQFGTVRAQLEQLDKQLDNMQHNVVAGESRGQRSQTNDDGASVTSKTVKSHGVMDRLKNFHILGGGAESTSSSVSATQSGAKSDRSANDDGVVTMNAGDAELGKSLVNLSSRLRVVEDALGGDKQIKQWSSTASAGTAGGVDAGGGSVFGAVTMLKNQMSLLDAENIESLDHRLKTFIDRLEQATRKRQPLADDTVKRVNQVYDKLKTIDQASYTVPGALERLLAVSSSLKQTQSLSSDLDEMSRAQDDLLQKYAAAKELIDSMRKEFPKRADVVDAKLNDFINAKATS